MKLPVLSMVLVAGIAAGWWSASRGPVAGDGRGGGPDPLASKERVAAVPVEVRSRVRQVREARGGAARLREVVLLATNLPVVEMPAWFAGNYLEFLDDSAEDVFYQILTERWLEADPAGGARWMLEHEKGSVARAVASWVEADEAAAVAFVRGMPASRREEAASALVRAVGRRSVADALELLEQLRPAEGSVQVVGELARMDREAVMARAAAAGGELRRNYLQVAAGAWMKEDMPWVVAMMEREGLGPEVFCELANTTGAGEVGRLVLRHAALLPPGWLERLAAGDGVSVTLGSEAEWLNVREGRAGLPKRLLEQFQLQAAAMPWWYNDMRETGRKLVEGGDWLPVVARVKIAETLVLRWADDPDAARAWVAGLDGEFKAAGEKAFARMIAERGKARQARVPTTPSEVVAGLAAGTLTKEPELAGGWNPAEVSDAVRMVGSMEAEAAGRILGTLRSDSTRLPRPVGAALLSQALSVPTSGGGDDDQARQRMRVACEFAAEWAAESPRQAADWVTTLPAGDERLWAARNVALQWARYSVSEAREWASRLTESERRSVLAALDAP